MTLAPEAAHYLLHVLRLRDGAQVALFNGRDGEFSADLRVEKKRATLTPRQCLRAYEPPPPVDYLFAPLKRARLDYLAQKAVEMGARSLQPVITQRTEATRVNLERLDANAREACEQCGIVWRAQIHPPRPLANVLEAWPAQRLLVFCDEAAEVESPLEALSHAPKMPEVAVLVGPEGGFSEEERAAILRVKPLLRLSLGSRILRADTAAVAALALVQGVFYGR